MNTTGIIGQEYKIYGSAYYEALKSKEFPIVVQSKMLDESNRVQAQVQDHLNKPKDGDQVVISRIQKTFPSTKEITYEGRIRSAQHRARLAAS
jgi:hypothetical protein